MSPQVDGMSTAGVFFVPTLKNGAFCAYLICSCILVIKVLAMSCLTGFMRMKYKVAATAEDKNPDKQIEVGTHESVERVKRAHMNDLENIPFFFAAALAYLWTEPNTCAAAIIFFIYVLSRITHTIIYAVIPLGQPFRGICYLIGIAIIIYMSTHSIVYVLIMWCKKN